jgi:hypothetical protein
MQDLDQLALAYSSESTPPPLREGREGMEGIRCCAAGNAFSLILSAHFYIGWSYIKMLKNIVGMTIRNSRSF